MKIFLICALLSLLSGCVLAQPPTSCFTLKAVDAETGALVSNALVRVTFIEKEDPWGNGTGKFERQSKLTDEDGLAKFKGISYGPGGGGSVESDGYYQTTAGTNYSHANLALNRWEPWNPTIEVKMRPKKNPVPMVNKFQKWTVVPVFGKPVGYDLDSGDWVAPYGKGKSKDFIFVMNLNRKSMSDAEASYTLTFSNPLDGIQEYLPSENLSSSFIFPYEAPTNGYTKSLYQHDINTPYAPSKTTEKDNVNYIFRVRTETDKDGNIISACYGRIRGELQISRKGQIQFSYWFNPNPHSRSLESLKKPY